MSHQPSLLQRMLLFIEDSLDSKISTRYNPFHYLGAIAVFLIVLLLASGAYLLIYYRIDLKLVYQSIQYLTEDQRYIGGIIRSIHRYAADGLVIITILHLLRTYILDKYSGWRWVAWVSGVALLAILWITGILGYMMVWDQRAQLIAGMTAELLDYFPIFAEKFTRAFLGNDTITFYMFFVIIFLHIAVPVFLFFAIWVHVSRTSRPVINPPHAISFGILLILLTLAILKPAVSTPPADLDKIPAEIPTDWFYLFPFPVYTATSAAMLWIIAISGNLFLLSMPWLKRRRKIAVAKIDKVKCVGCTQCDIDCPYEALYMSPRTDSMPFDKEASLIPQRCASCGICIGSCDYEAISLSGWSDSSIRENISRLLESDNHDVDGVKILGLFCIHSVDMTGSIYPETMRLKDMPEVSAILFPCIGMVKPYFIEHALNAGADGIFTCGCKINDCYYREGNKWLKERLTGARRPSIRRDYIDRLNLRAYWLSAIQKQELFIEVSAFLEEIKSKREC